MIVFRNPGLIPIEAFTTFGVNAKPNTQNPIGHFGIGLKYTVAIVCRLGGTLTVLRGDETYVFYGAPMKFRDKEFTVVRMKKANSILGKWSYTKLPFTTELGKEWEPWMVVRELEANCRDEQGDSYAALMPPLNEPDMTIISVDCPAVEEAYHNLDDIFLNKEGRKQLVATKKLEVYEGQSDYIFYRGLRVTNLRLPSFLTYNFLQEVTLTEDRTSMYTYSDMNRIVEMYMNTEDTALLNRLLSITKYKINPKGSAEFYEETLPFDQPYITPCEAYKKAVRIMATNNSHIPSRIYTYYGNYLKPSIEEPTYGVRLTRRELEDVLTHLPIESTAREKCATVLHGLTPAATTIDDGIPF